MQKKRFEFKNSKGTKFYIPIDSKNEKDIAYLHNQICSPGDQVIDMFTWFQKVLVHLKRDYYTKK